VARWRKRTLHPKPSRERIRLLHATAALLEHRLKKEMAQYCVRAEVVAVSTRLASFVREKTLELPDRLAPTIAHMTDQHAIHALLSKEIHDMLCSIAEGCRTLRAKDTQA
jgi:hypothetical protein